MKDPDQKLTDKTASLPLEEAPVWEPVKGTWSQVYGNFQEMGLSIEWHDFSTDKKLDWSNSFHPDSLEICLNFSGLASLQADSRELKLEPEQIALYTTTEQRTKAERHSGHLHRFFTVEMSAEFLRRQFVSVMDGLKPEVLRFIEGSKQAKPLLEVLPMSPALLINRIQFLSPPVTQNAAPVWYQSKVTEILSHFLFKEDGPAEFFCHRQERLNRERCERVLYLLERDLENPPSLDMLAKEVKCSPFYLSRLFAQEAGMSIPKYLRLKRIEKAGEYLISGKMNVTEAAMAVGYSSLSAFNKAFVEQFGVCPGLYPVLKTGSGARKTK